MSSLERALKHFDKLVENGLLDAIDTRLEEYELEETVTEVLAEHAGEEPYFPPDHGELETDYADAFTYAVEEVHRRLWPRRLP